ncbi:MAG: helix-hairpin-helix domain-containing protein [Bacteroidetes bacterium]|nr:helix-hairpin-helix domain-containing protein [Bacteroidota bacterium]MBU1374000.1 helix-hairpin-helix domain-containing protein [Bacteroidota bacterium]MBU1484660.1 helix-hairpin-helix domain-containing protein [Bacteroidota bacterium]MBU1759888.1 helix-hairpin-helix domain-containing protein [Bacteroidota bacterium]MBU2377444.1 helix-hairpin-helix domain-containing protein [Bacteroidota bacterium]
MNQKLKHYLEITRKELRGIIVFLIILLLIYLTPYLFEKLITPSSKITVETLDPQIKDIESFDQKGEKSTKENFSQNENLQTVLFNFNPNNLAIEDWMKLGLSEKQARTIKNYEAKGGRFKTKADVEKMYSISASTYEKLAPYIQIPDENSPGFKDKTLEMNTAKIENVKSTSPKVILDINKADSAEFTQIKGIGPAFASRIVKYRNRLGGFYKKEQLQEVWGLDSIKYAQIENQTIISNIQLHQININNCTFDEFKTFPYLSYKQMNAIINYRIQHGDYKALDDLNKIMILNTDVIKKIAPYITLK